MGISCHLFGQFRRVKNTLSLSLSQWWSSQSFSWGWSDSRDCLILSWRERGLHQAGWVEAELLRWLHQQTLWYKSSYS